MTCTWAMLTPGSMLPIGAKRLGVKILPMPLGSAWPIGMVTLKDGKALLGGAAVSGLEIRAAAKPAANNAGDAGRQRDLTGRAQANDRRSFVPNAGVRRRRR